MRGVRQPGLRLRGFPCTAPGWRHACSALLRHEGLICVAAVAVLFSTGVNAQEQDLVARLLYRSAFDKVSAAVCL